MATTTRTGGRGQFRVAAIGTEKCTLESFIRRDFYKISLVTGGWPPVQLFYGSLAPIDIDKAALIITNPLIPHSWSVREPILAAEGYFCVFDDRFIRSSAKFNSLANLLFIDQKSPVYFPDPAALQFLSGLFTRMCGESATDYAGKDDLFQSHVSLIFHEALQLRGAENKDDTGFSRIATEFIQLLRRQFPLDLPLQPIGLRKASDFADRISVHVNHLNSAVQKLTGKSTSQHISEQLMAEARSLLTYTNYSVAEIAFALGFEYQSYFNRFFKKHTGQTPSDFRRHSEKYKYPFEKS
jgi:AraC-like DNA-binding protein